MRNLFYLLLVAVLFSNTLYSQESKDYSEYDFIVKFKSDIEFDVTNALLSQDFNIERIDALNNKFSIEKIEAIGNLKEGRTFLLTLNYKEDIKQVVKDYFNTGLFEYAEPNYIGQAQFTPNDPLYYNRQWYHFNDGTFEYFSTTEDSDMDTDLAWDITQGDTSIVVAFLDSGLKLDHPEFEGRVWGNNDEATDGNDTDDNGYVDDSNGGWDFVNDDNDPSDDNSHGTATTGACLATGNNDIGYAGINWFSKIMVCKVLGSTGYGNTSWYASAIYYAVDNGANVINMSLGGSGSNLLEEAVNYAYNNNVYVVAAGGNGGILNGTGYPAGYENALAIGSTDPDDTRTTSFDGNPEGGSNYGPLIDFVAPGNYFYFMDHLTDTNYEQHGGGTSAATTMVTGVISLILSINPNLTPSEIKTILIESSEDQVGDSDDTPGWDQYYGHGRINAYNAVTHSLVTGLEDIAEVDNVTIVFPNPAKDNISINNLGSGAFKIILIDILGREQYRYSTTTIGGRISMVIPDLPAGSYFLNITEMGLNNSFTKKVVIQ